MCVPPHWKAMTNDIELTAMAVILMVAVAMAMVVVAGRPEGYLMPWVWWFPKKAERM